MRGFADHVVPGGDGYLMLVGPAVTEVADYREGAAVYGECLLQWHDLPPAARARILLVTLPLDDIDENAAMVNALQACTPPSSRKRAWLKRLRADCVRGNVEGPAHRLGGRWDHRPDSRRHRHPAAHLTGDPGHAARLLLDDQAEAARMGGAHACASARTISGIST